MHKLKNTYIDKMIAAQLSNAEVDFILYNAKFQDEQGVIQSVYYKTVCDAIGISYQKFYDILNSLSDKRLICYEKTNRADVVVRLIGNTFSNQDFKEGYFNVGNKNLQHKTFMGMKAGSKLLYLYSQRFVNGKHEFVAKFYEDFCALFNVTKKCLQNYIHELKVNKYLFISRKRNKAYHYEMTLKRSTVLELKGIGIPGEKQNYIYNSNFAH